MPPTFVDLILLAGAYLIGSIPFGYLIGRMKGVDLFASGSGNIGATNAGRVLGARFGILVFVLDFLKGALPCAAIVPLARLLNSNEVIPDSVLRVAAAASAFLGHMFPVYLGFRGGKGVATGAGTIFVLVPGAAALAIAVWVAVLLSSRMVSLASLVAASVLVGAHLLGTGAPFSEDALPISLYLIVGAAIVFVKHWKNIERILGGTESRIRDFSMRQTVIRGVHIVAVGFWFGGAGFFNFVAAPAIFASFERVVAAGASDRTAYRVIISPDASANEKDALAKALAGSAVAPIFPRYFAMQAICGILALVTAVSWLKADGKVHRWRVYAVALGVLAAAVGWPISNYVGELRMLRFSPDSAIAASAKADFAAWHLASLFLSFVSVGSSGVALALASKLPAVLPAKSSVDSAAS